LTIAYINDDTTTFEALRALPAAQANGILPAQGERA